ncbi:hypothetical protein M378DRAFT_79037 [Amanita muscaria Koide BX008]|uniref:MPN domain-containing protein n=1 Tax=Amanita muscaria (strain Koide BX008) TaxID=946122 RepID=A0A0C2X3T1_AMAMK|nr:hypothetical protein M378DRAFT_79037 [Amanita muscaria Koide BX008]
MHNHRPPRSASSASYLYQSAQRPSPPTSSYASTSQPSHLRPNYPELRQGVTPAPVPTPPIIQAPPRSQPHHQHVPYPNETRGLKVVTVPKDCLQKFLGIASANTAVNKETCGLLLGKDKGSKYTVTTLLIPKQHSSSDTCTMDEEELVLQFTEERSLITLGWIHTHPSQSCFMSSVDLHTHSGFQRMLPESFAIVCAPKSKPNFGIFRLTDPPGLKTILDCKATDAFHPHPDLPIYTDADKGHVQMKEGPLEIVDLR